MSAPGVVFRPATAEDAAEWSAFAERVFVETFAKDNTPENFTTYLRSAFSTDLQTREIADPNAFVLLAFVSGSLAGYAHLDKSEVPASIDDDSALELKRFYVAKEWQGRGLANSLMHETMQHARARGARTLWLGVWEHNPRAIAFYRKQGFREVGSHPFLIGDDRQTDLEMAIALDTTHAGLD
jgi:diamine N-acetyltransferase